MGTTVRKGIFETNSSSTHSITIEDFPEVTELIINDILFCENLRHYVIYNEAGYSGNSFILICDSPIKKAAFIYSYLAYFNEDPIYNEYLKGYYDFIKSTLNVEEVIPDAHNLDELVVSDYNTLDKLDLNALFELTLNNKIIKLHYESSE